eukprot:g5472.t1
MARNVRNCPACGRKAVDDSHTFCTYCGGALPPPLAPNPVARDYTGAGGGSCGSCAAGAALLLSALFALIAFSTNSWLTGSFNLPHADTGGLSVQYELSQQLGLYQWCFSGSCSLSGLDDDDDALARGGNFRRLAAGGTDTGDDDPAPSPFVGGCANAPLSVSKDSKLTLALLEGCNAIGSKPTGVPGKSLCAYFKQECASMTAPDDDGSGLNPVPVYRSLCDVRTKYCGSQARAAAAFSALQWLAAAAAAGCHCTRAAGRWGRRHAALGCARTVLSCFSALAGLITVSLVGNISVGLKDTYSSIQRLKINAAHFGHDLGADFTQYMPDFTPGYSFALCIVAMLRPGSAGCSVVNKKWVPSGVEVATCGEHKGKAIINGVWKTQGISVSGNKIDYPVGWMDEINVAHPGAKRTTKEQELLPAAVPVLALALPPPALPVAATLPALLALAISLGGWGVGSGLADLMDDLVGLDPDVVALEAALTEGVKGTLCRSVLRLKQCQITRMLRESFHLEWEQRHRCLAHRTPSGRAC